MAYLLDTELNALQTRTVQTELKNKKHGALKFVSDQTVKNPSITQEVKTAVENANGRYVDISALKEVATNVTTTFSYDITPNLSTSEKTRVTVYTFMTSFQYNPYTFVNNAIGESEYLINKLDECDKALANAVSAQEIAILEARKTQILDVTGAPTGIDFNDSDYVTITAAQQTNPFFDYLSTIMLQNNLDGEYSALGSISLGHVIANHRLYGANNDKNLMGQAFPMVYGDVNLAPTSGSNATMYLVKDGAIGIIPTYPAIFKAGENRIPGIEFSIGASPLVRTGLQPLIMKQTAAYDESALSGHQAAGMSLVQNYKIGVSFALVYSYNSAIASTVNDVVKVELTTA